MGGATEMLEKMEHAAHAGGGHGGHGGEGEGAHHGPGKGIGITMAILGVLLALTAAFVGSERTELVKTMVEQSNVWGEYQTQSMKHRAMLTQLQTLHALTPSREEVAKFETELDKLKNPPATTAPPSKDGERERTAELLANSNAQVVATVKLATRELADILSPDLEDSAEFVDRIWEFGHERDEAHEWFESYEDEVNAHFGAAEWYEKAQLASEIGIVVASIGLLLGSRPFWYLSIVAGLTCAGIIGYTWFTTHGALSTTCDEGDHTKGVPPRVPIHWEPLKRGEKKQANTCYPGAVQKIEHEKETYEEMKRSTNSAADDEHLITTVLENIRKHNKIAPAGKQIPIPVDEQKHEGAHGAAPAGHGEHAPSAPASSAAAPHEAAPGHH